MDSFFEIFEACGNDTGAIEARNLFKKHVNREPIGQGAGEGKESNA